MVVEPAERLAAPCPGCGHELEVHQIDGGVVWTCPACHGRSVGIGLLRKTVAAPYVNQVWGDAIERDILGSHECPSCGRRMLQGSTETVTLDVCKSCQLVWFDPGEFEAAPIVRRASRRRSIPESALEEMARVEARAIADRYQRLYGKEMPLEEALLMVPGVMGLPLEEESSPLARVPWVTWSLAAAMGIAGAWALLDPEVVERFGLIPADAFRLGGLTFITAFFVHGGLFQLLTNLYFLAVFGDNVEDFLGSVTFLLLVAVGALTGEALHALFADARTVPLAGANAGVCAVTIFYALKFPRAKLRYFRVFRWYTMPASSALLFWFLVKLVGSRQPLLGEAEPSLLAFMGGAAIGLLFWFLWRRD